MDNERIYIALARDLVTKDDIVFGVRAGDPAQARFRVEQYYMEHEWGMPLAVTAKTFRANSVNPVVQVGHAHAEYCKLEEQIRTLCQKLLEVADGADLIIERDDLYAFVGQFEIGQKLIEGQFPKE